MSPIERRSFAASYDLTTKIVSGLVVAVLAVLAVAAPAIVAAIFGVLLLVAYACSARITARDGSASPMAKRSVSTARMERASSYCRRMAMAIPFFSKLRPPRSSWTICVLRGRAACRRWQQHYEFARCHA